MHNQYSEKELQLLRFFDFEKHINNLLPHVIYNMIAHECFIFNDSGPAVDSIRRCIQALDNCHPHRMTKEFDDLIYLED